MRGRTWTRTGRRSTRPSGRTRPPDAGRVLRGRELPLPTIEALRRLGHDVLTALEAGQANQRIKDDAVLEYATRSGRAVLTLNRWDFVGLHGRSPGHAGIIVCSQDADSDRQAAAIDVAVREQPTLQGSLIRVNRPASP